DDAAAPARPPPRRAGCRGGGRPPRRGPGGRGRGGRPGGGRAPRRHQGPPPAGARGGAGGTGRRGETPPPAGEGRRRGALEGNVAYGAVDPERYRGRAVVQLGTVPGGYAWIFPKGDHANVGVGGWGHAGPRLREHLSDLCRAYDVPEERVTDLRGHRLPM